MEEDVFLELSKFQILNGDFEWGVVDIWGWEAAALGEEVWEV